MRPRITSDSEFVAVIVSTYDQNLSTHDLVATSSHDKVRGGQVVLWNPLKDCYAVSKAYHG